jgi:hypothetical protein
LQAPQQTKEYSPHGLVRGIAGERTVRVSVHLPQVVCTEIIEAACIPSTYNLIYVINTSNGIAISLKNRNCNIK